MRKIITAFAVAGSVLLGGCATGPDGKPVFAPPTPTNIQTGIDEVKKWADTFCSFVPTNEVVRAIIASFTGSIDYVGMARGLCDAVTARSATPGKRPTFNGVPIYGRFKR